MGAAMLKTYRSDHSNQVHQLLVSVSKHFHVLKDGRLRDQKKPFEVTLEDMGASDKRHVVHYLVRDHFSNVFYAEIGLSSDPIYVGEFLFRAWSKKEAHRFCGMPEILIVPKTVLAVFPKIVNMAKPCQIAMIPATSGFQAGVRVLRTWENDLWCDWKMEEWRSFEEARDRTSEISRERSSQRGGKETYIEKWLRRLTSVRLPPDDVNEFLRVYDGGDG